MGFFTWLKSLISQKASTQSNTGIEFPTTGNGNRKKKQVDSNGGGLRKKR